MIDERLQQTWEVDARRKAAAVVEGHPRLAELESWVAGWWNDFEHSIGDAEEEPSWTDEAIAALRKPFEDELSHAVEHWLIARDHDRSPHSSAALLIARVVGRETGRGAVSIARFSRAEQLVVRTAQWGDEFFRAFVGAVSAEAKESWIEALEAFDTTLEACCEGHWSAPSHAELAALREEEARRTQAGEKGSLWGHRETRSVIPSTTVLMRVRGLFALAPRAATAALERIPSMSLRHLSVYFMSITDDADALLAAIEAAPLLWEGDRWTGNSVAPLFVEALTKHAKRLASAIERQPLPAIADVGSVERVYQQELPNLFQRMTATLLRRADGRWLAVDYATELLRKTSWSHDQKRGRVEQLALSALLDGLRAAGVQSPDVRRIGRRRLSPADRFSHRLEFLSVAGFVVDSTMSARKTWSEITTLLLEAGDDDITGTVESYLVGTLLFAGVGRALARTEEPRVAWGAVWRDLYPRRECARFEVLASKGLLSSAYLALIGLAAIHDLVGRDSAAAKDLWDEVLAALRQLMLAPREDAIQLKMYQLAGVAWAFARHVAPDDWFRRLDRWKDVFATDPVACLFAADFLTENGIPVRRVIELFREAGCDPVRLGTELCSWLAMKGFGVAVEDVDVARIVATLKET